MYKQSRLKKAIFINPPPENTQFPAHSIRAVQTFLLKEKQLLPLKDIALKDQEKQQEFQALSDN
jgi:hypothetical protein